MTRRARPQPPLVASVAVILGILISVAAWPGVAPAAAATPTAAPSPTPLPTAALQQALSEIRTKHGIPGVSATIIWPDGRSWWGGAGYANVATRTPVTRNTPFAVGSVTKTFVAALILQLAEEGRLGLEDPVVRWLPTAPVDPAVTIRQLLDHTSGVYDFFSNSLIDPALTGNKRRAWTPALDLRYVKGPYFTPGAGWHYSNTNYILLGLIAQKAAGGAGVPAQLRARFIGPLRLLTVTYQGVEPPRVPVAHAYTFKTAGAAARPIDQADGTAIVPFTSVTTAAGPAGALAASSWDLARWARALYRGRVLRPESLGAMLDVSRSEPFRPIYPYGLGVQQATIGGWPAIGHGGRLIGTRAVMRYFPDTGVTVAVTTNQWRTDPDLVVRALVGIALPPPPVPIPSPFPSASPPPAPSPTALP